MRSHRILPAQRRDGEASREPAVPFALAIALIVVAFATPVLSRRLTGDYFPPAAIVLATWAGGLGLFGLELVPYRPLTAPTPALLVWAVILLVAGSSVAQWLAFRGARPASMPGTRLGAGWITIFGLLGMAGVAWYVHGVVQFFGWSGFGNGEALRSALMNKDIPSTFLYLQFFCMTTPLVAAAVWLSGGRVRLHHAALCAVCVAATLVTTDRTQFFTVLVSVVFMYLFARGPSLPLRRVVAIAVLCPLVLAANFAVVDAWRGYPQSRRLTSAYIYATAAFPALDVAVHANEPSTEGLYTAYPITRLLQRLRLKRTESPPYILPFVTVTRDGAEPTETNVYTALYYPFRDFGIRGALAYAAAIGVACGLAFGWARRDRRSPLGLLLVGQLCGALLFLPFVNKFNNTAWWYVLVWSLVPFVVAPGWRRKSNALNVE
jgi:oligosaccharide repeat unit polymerase